MTRIQKAANWRSEYSLGLLHTARSFAIQELQDGLGIDDEDEEFTLDGRIPQDNILKVTAGLLSVQGSEVGLRHPTA
jgi:hypothetical protein